MKTIRKYLALDPGLLLKTAAAELVLSVAFTMLWQKGLSRAGFTESCFLMAILFVCVGLFRLTKKLQFYTMLSFGLKKLLEAFNLGRFGEDGGKLKDYPEYLKAQKKHTPWLESVVSGLAFAVISSMMIYC